jgi:hypothetical protein
MPTSGPTNWAVQLYVSVALRMPSGSSVVRRKEWRPSIRFLEEGNGKVVVAELAGKDSFFHCRGKARVGNLFIMSKEDPIGKGAETTTEGLGSRNR